MTLILATGVHGRFVAISGDRRRIYQTFQRNPETGQYDIETDLPLQIDDKEHTKVFKISDYAIMGTSGASDLCKYFQREIIEVVQPSDDLMDIKEKLEVIVSKASIDPDLPQRHRFRKKDGIQVLIAGFYGYEFLTGYLCLAVAEGGTVDVTLTTPNKHHCYAMATPVDEYGEVLHELFHIPFAKVTKRPEHVKKLKWIHKLISRAHPDRVSSNGDLHVLHCKEKGGKAVLEHRQSVFET